MNNTTAFCPQCKQDVQFQHSGELVVCPACGYSYKRSGAPLPDAERNALTAGQVVFCLIWMLAPSFIALCFLQFLFDPKGGGVSGWLPYALLLTAANSLVAAFWLAGRVTQKRVLAIFLGLIMGGTVFGLNVTVVFLASCVSMLAGGKL